MNFNIIWIHYILFFSLFAKSLWFFYYFTLYAFEDKKYNKKFNGFVTAIIPVYNEDRDNLIDTIISIMRTKGIDEVIFVNDGSTNDSAKVLREYQFLGYKFIDLKQNVGKRKAQYEAVKISNPKTDVYVFMDSDTVLREDSIIELTKPFNDPGIGATTSNILVKNRDDNLITKIISAMYWSASNIWRDAPSKLGFVQVTNGQLSAYRGDKIREYMQDYINQYWMGVNCTLSDDRYLTHKIQTQDNLIVKYVKSAVAYTVVPNTIKGAYKMFLRWKRGAWRESILILRKAKKKPLLVADIWANHLVQIMQTIVRIAVIFLSIIYTPVVAIYYLIVMLIISLLFNYHMIWENFKEVKYKLLYTIFNETIFGWVHLHALLTIKRQGRWDTR